MNLRYIFFFAILIISSQTAQAQSRYKVVSVKGAYCVIEMPKSAELKKGGHLRVYRNEGNGERAICKVTVDKIISRYFRARITKDAFIKQPRKGDFILVNESAIRKSYYSSSRKKNNWQVGISIGTNIDATYDYTPNNNLNYTKFVPQKSFGFSGGLQLDYRLYKNLYLNFSPFFTWNMSVWNIKSNDGDWESVAEFQQIELPLVLKVKTGPVYFLAGVNYSFVLSAISETDDIEDMGDDAILFYTAGIGVQFNVAKRWALFIESRFDYSPQNLLIEDSIEFSELFPGGPKFLTGILYQF